MDDVIKRLKTELEELRDKENKLVSFFGKATSESLVSVNHHNLISIQIRIMDVYQSILEMRIDDLETKQILQELSEEDEDEDETD